MSTIIDKKPITIYYLSMNRSALRAAMKLKHLNAASLAKRAALTRQAISKWKLTQPDVGATPLNPSLQTVQQISQALNLSITQLTTDPFASLDPSEKQKLTTLLLWDHLYDSFENFVVALVKLEYRAVARYVQTFGILRAHKIFGVWIYDALPRYSSYLPPVKRKEILKLCQVLREENLI